MELNDRILKSVDSAVIITSYEIGNFFIIRYKGKIFSTSKPMFSSAGRAKSFLVSWVTNIFRQGEYWQSCSNNVKKNKKYEIDLSATIKILPSYGLTSRFDDLKNKKMFKDLTEELLKNKIFTIEKLNII